MKKTPICGIIFYAIILIFYFGPIIIFNTINGIRYNQLRGPMDCKILDVRNCVRIYNQEYNYYCNLDAYCENFNTSVSIGLPSIPASGDLIYVEFDKDEIGRLKEGFITFNSLFCLIAPLVLAFIGGLILLYLDERNKKIKFNENVKLVKDDSNV